MQSERVQLKDCVTLKRFLALRCERIYERYTGKGTPATQTVLYNRVIEEVKWQEIRAFVGKMQQRSC